MAGGFLGAIKTAQALYKDAKEDHKESPDRDRYAFFGVPITSAGGKDVRAVVYLDAGETGFFDAATIDGVVDCCAGLASWIDEHYYSKR